MSSNAQRDLYADAVDLQQSLGADGAAPLRRIAAERLAAHRSRRAVLEPQAASAPRTAPSVASSVSDGARRAREAVEARYRAAPSFREVMAAEPPTVTRAVTGTAVATPPPPVAAVPPPTAVEAERLAPSPRTASAEEDFAWLHARPAQAASRQAALPPAGASHAAQNMAAQKWVRQSMAVPEALSMPEGALQVRPYEDLPQLTTPPTPQRPQQAAPAEEIAGLDEEIAFRLAPEFADHLIDPLPIQANIIEFPRQLVAARKARPRLAEGPLRTDDVAEHRAAAPHDPAAELELAKQQQFQMRIFEVDPAYADAPSGSARAPAQAAIAEPEAPAVPEWQHLMLDAAEEEDNAPSWVPAPTPEMPALPARDAGAPPPVASMELRFMSLLVDAICVGAAFVAFAVVAGWLGGQQLRAVPLPTLGLISAALLALLAVFYQALFFTLSHATPGMFYANLVFKTLAGREPSRRMLRRRVGANVVAALPLGLGLLWSVVDRRGLGWNDRISGVFLREY